jgi:hypothetical protein
LWPLSAEYIDWVFGKPLPPKPASSKAKEGLIVAVACQECIQTKGIALKI